MAGQMVRASSIGIDMMTSCGSSFSMAALSLSTSSSSFCLQRVPKSSWRALWGVDVDVEEDEDEDEDEEDGADIDVANSTTTTMTTTNHSRRTTR